MSIETAFKMILAKDLPQAVLTAEQEHNDKNHEIWVCLHCQDTKSENGPVKMSSLKPHLKYR